MRFIVLFVIAAKELIAPILDCVANNFQHNAENNHYSFKLEKNISTNDTKVRRYSKQM
jgi:hypothetical protein